MCKPWLGRVRAVRTAKHGRHGASMAMVMANYVKDAAAQDRAKAVGAAPVLALLVELLHSLEVQAVVVEDDHVHSQRRVDVAWLPQGPGGLRWGAQHWFNR